MDPFHETPDGRSIAPRRAVPPQPLAKTPEIVGAIHIGNGIQYGTDESAAQKSLQRVLKREATPPPDTAKDPVQLPSCLKTETNQEVSSVRTGTQNGTTGTQLAEGLREGPGRQFRRVRADDHGGRMMAEKVPESPLQTFTKVPAALPLAMETFERGRKDAAGEEEIRLGALRQATDFAHRIGNKRRLEIPRSGRAQ